MAGVSRLRADRGGALNRLRQAERRRISRALHDETGPLVCAAGLAAELLRGELETATPQQEELLARLSGALESAVNSVRLLSQEAAPGLASRRGIAGALSLLAEAHRAGLRIESLPEPSSAQQGDALCELVRDILLALEGGGAEIAADSHGIRIEAPRPVDAEMEDALGAAARAAGFEFAQRAEGGITVMELRPAERG